MKEKQDRNSIVKSKKKARIIKLENDCEMIQKIEEKTAIKSIVICKKEIMRKKIEDFDAKIKKIKENFQSKNLKNI